jgi:hypothetical protein
MILQEAGRNEAAWSRRMSSSALATVARLAFIMARPHLEPPEHADAAGIERR